MSHSDAYTEKLDTDGVHNDQEIDEEDMEELQEEE